MKINFKVCGLEAKHFIPFFIIVMVAVYCGFMSTTTVGSDEYVATTFVGTIAFLMAVGGLFFWLGNTIPIVNNYLGGACLLPLLGASFINFIGIVPQELVNGTKVLMSGGFQDAYIAMLLVGSILVMDRKILLGATIRYLPTVIGSQVFALGFCALAGMLTGTGVTEALFNIGAPCMSGGSGGAMTTLPRLYSDLSGTDMMPMAGQFLCYASISNVIAIMLAAIVGSCTSNMKTINGAGNILKVQGSMDVKEEKRPGTSADYAALGSGIFMAFTLYLLGNIFGNLPGLSVIPGLAWTIIFGIIIKWSGILPNSVGDNCVYAMNFALKALLPMLIAGIGVNSLKFQTLGEFFTPAAFIVIFVSVVGALVGAMLFGHITGLFAYEAGVTAGLCCCNIGGSGDLAVLSAANRMNLLAFASISTRIGGALMVIWIGLLYPMFH